MKISVKLHKQNSAETKDGFPVVVYASQNYKEKVWRTGYFSKPAHWNSKLASPMRKHPNYYLFLDYLNDLKRRINELQLKEASRRFTFEEVKEYLFRVNKNTFYELVMDGFEPDYKGTQWSAIRSFDKTYPKIPLDQITHELVEEYHSTLLRKGNKPSGVDSYIRSLKALWNKYSDRPNPFKGIKTEIPDTIKRVASENDIRKLIEAELEVTGDISGAHHFRNYWLLMFYLGGIDPEVLAKLRYDQNLAADRIVFNRDKGRSKTACNNKVFPEVFAILKEYKEDSYPYFVPIYKSSSYKTFSGNFNRRLKQLCQRLELDVELRPKSARYTFIDRAQQLLVDERITAQIVGHKRRTTTSIYTNDFPLSVQDEMHKKVISIVK